ncbi:MAG: hypothetical protein AMXMBFR59_13080 [Rhodanobacteraceae bacterium]
MDVCLPADFQIEDESSPLRLRFVDEGPASYEDGYWLGAEALVAIPAPPAAAGPARRRRTRIGDDPSWCVV